MATTTTGRLEPDAVTRLFDPDTHTYWANDRVMPSVTQVLTEQRFIDFSNVPPDVMATARDRGSYVHAALHASLEDDFDVDDCDPRFRGYLDSGLAFVAEAGLAPVKDPTGRIISVEYRFFHLVRWFAGTVDYIGIDRDGILTIADWKTGHPTDVAAALQTAAYEFGIRQCLAPVIGYSGQIRRMAVKLFRDGTPAKPEPYSDPRDLSVFLSALACVHYKRNGMAHGNGGYANAYR